MLLQPVTFVRVDGGSTADPKARRLNSRPRKPQAPEEAGFRSGRAGDGLAGLVRMCEATKMEDAALQVGRMSSALPLRSFCCPQLLRPSAPPHHPPHSPVDQLH